MTRSPFVGTVLGLAALVAHSSTALAQNTAPNQTLQLRTGTVTLAGTSNLRSFSCASSTLDAHIAIDRDSAPGSSVALLPRIALEVTVPVKSLDCGPGGITSDMVRTLHGDQFPSITYRLQSYDVVAGTMSSDSVHVTATGILTVAGRDKVVEMLVTGRRMADGQLSAVGSVVVNMTDFGIPPPRFFLGTLRVHNSITVHFDLSAEPASADGPTMRR